MPRFAAGLEYDGRAYSGWQFQPGLNTVQDVLQRALGRVADAPIDCICAGRTDAGVHALAQVVHFDSDAPRSERAWRLGANTYLPRDVSVVWVREVPEHFHARYGALARSYRYLILNRDSRPGLAMGRATWERRPLDAVRMHASARALLGEHDFSAFRAIECQSKSPVKTLDRLDVIREGDELRVRATARSFLHNQVRSMVGTLKKVGEGKWPVNAVADALAAADRARSGPVAPADGLYLVAVDY
jgi:tRNA pseudouridine38-40 synthase